MNHIEPVPASGRNFRGIDFFFLWAGAAVSLAEIWAGGLLTPVGLTTGLVLVLLGHLIGNTPLALGGLIGSDTGLPTMVMVRPAFGRRGSLLPTLLNLLQLVGWAGVMLWIGGQAAAAVWPLPGGAPTWIGINGLITTLWAIAGHRHWKRLQGVAVGALLLLCVVMTLALLQHPQWTTPSRSTAPGGTLPLMVGLDLVIAMPISWLPLVCDYSRYAADRRDAFWGTWLGYFLVSCWMYGLGLVAALATASTTPEQMVLDLMVHLGLAMPALVIVVASTFTTTFLDVYSAAVSALNIRAEWSERRLGALFGLLGTLLALVFPADAYEPFLLLIGSVFCPLFGVVLTDYFFFDRGRYADAGRSGDDFNPRGLLAWALGCLCYQGLQHGTRLGSSLPSLIVAGLIYALLMKFVPRGGGLPGRAVQPQESTGGRQ